MSDHPYVQHPVFKTRDHCEYRHDEEKDGVYGACGEPKSTHVAGLLGRGEVQNPREGEPGDAETYEGKPLFEHGPLGFCDLGPSSRVLAHPRSSGVCANWRPVPKEKSEPRKRWPRKVGWTKLLARRKACNHTFGVTNKEFRFQWAKNQCPRCLADEVAYWKGRTHSAEGQRKAMIRAAETALVQVEAARSLIAR